MPMVAWPRMFSLLAIAAGFLGLLLMAASPVLGFLSVCAGVASASAAMKRPDDLPFALGLAMIFACAFAAWQWVGFIAARL